jgi:hypothetical protein
MFIESLKGCAVGALLLGLLNFGGSAVAAAPAPRLTLPCSAIPPSAAHPVVTCRLTGQGFAPHETLAITYRVEIQWMQGMRNHNHKQIITQRRHAVTDGHGNFRRPPFSFEVPSGGDMRVWKVGVYVQIHGERGDHAATSTIGVAD